LWENFRLHQRRQLHLTYLPHPQQTLLYLLQKKLTQNCRQLYLLLLTYRRRRRRLG
jgi:hypothetical protein